ncbi:MAG: 6-phosphogluconolactonase [Microthrixaceae bacterium]|nr:6-phosphogluconolactonase [Microthrixaceae bacterium]
MCGDPVSLAVAAAAHVTARAVQSVAATGWFHFAVSGGSTPWAMFAHLSRGDMPWRSTSIYQVDERIALTSSPYRGHPRLTLTYPALARADQLLWLVSGASKAPTLRRLLSGDHGIPAGRVTAAESVVMADLAAAGDRDVPP